MLKKLLKIQMELKAPKNQHNSFGNYNYRSAEDILEAVKPICHLHNAVLFISDSLEILGDRVYVKACATITCIETGVSISATGIARESLEKKGMDSSQITGSTSSYSRKYALNGLFCIDDTKDADCNLPIESKTKTPTIKTPTQPATHGVTEKHKELGKLLMNSFGKEVGIQKLSELTTWTNKEGKTFVGKTQIDKLTDKEAEVTLSKLKKLLKESASSGESSIF